MKKVVCISASVLLFTTLAFADTTGLGTIKGPIDTDLFGFIGNITKYIRPLIAVVFLFVIIYGGFTRMTATGDPEKEQKSMKILTAGIVGFIIIVLAPVIVKILAAFLGVQQNVL